MANVKLTPSIKQLLKLRKPDALASPSLIQLNKAFNKTFRDAQAKKAETGWLVASTSTLVTANRPSTVGHLYRFATRSSLLEAGTQTSLDLPTAVNKAAIMREAALKSVIFIGVPRVILSLAALHAALDDDVKKALRTNSRRSVTPETIESIVTRGKAHWDGLYVPFQDSLYDKLGGYHPDFIKFIIQCYGSVLSPLPGATKSFGETSGLDDPDQGNLSRVMGSIVGMAALRAEGGVGPQLVSHTFGLAKARVLENLNEEDRWLSSDEGTQWILETVDEILDGVSAEDGLELPKSKL